MKDVKARLGATIPDDWEWKESLTLLAGQGEANVIFSSEPLDPSVDLDQYCSVQGELLAKEFPGYQQIAFEPMRMLGQREGRLRRFEWDPPDSVRVTQLQLYYVEDSRGYTATATTATTNFQNAAPALTETLERLTLDRV